MAGNPDVRSTVDSFAVAVTRIRRAAATVNGDGFRVVGASTSSTVRVVWWDAPASVVARLPEGQIGARAIEGVTRDELRHSVVAGTLPADLLVVDGVTFEVESVAGWATGPAGVTTIRQFVAREVATT